MKMFARKKKGFISTFHKEKSGVLFTPSTCLEGRRQTGLHGGPSVLSEQLLQEVGEEEQCVLRRR